ncbi:hypothetical protein [Actinobacillus delphinicola]|uniref:Site-specific DNA methylase n=1 Tax=Actinobacillus delphinicola TaxID=51161 RepID=A0A448TUZ3_9PAST|nr:hypothetical protein [Actinobacillus delphinicola]VEJ09757.1 Site-specific DNA methylase [Actinobacillus delphinicola]
MTLFKQAPLPFTGQKRQFLSHFNRILNENISNHGEGWTILDVFGGSGLLSHNSKYIKPNARVIYNDFDGYTERLGHIADTNRLRSMIYAVVADDVKNTRLSESKKAKILNIIHTFDGYLDTQTIASWLLFSGNQISSLDELKKKTLWHGIRKNDYPTAEDYLDGIEVVSESFHTLLPKFANQKNVLLLLDPPYLCTNQKSYKQATYFDLIDFLRLINLTKPPYLFFSSTKSEFIRFIDFITENQLDNYESFMDIKKIVAKAQLNHQTVYEDNLIYKF